MTASPNRGEQGEGSAKNLTDAIPSMTPGPAPPRPIGRTLLLLALITTTAGLLRFLRLGQMSLWWDECHTLQLVGAIGRAPWTRVAEALLGGLSTYFLLLAPWATADLPEWALRLPSALAGVALVLVLVRLGKEIGLRHMPWTLGGLAALSPFLIWHSREARWYPVTWLLISVGALSYVKLLRRWHRGHAVACFVAGLLAGTTYAPAIVIPVSQAAWLFLIRRRRTGAGAGPAVAPRSMTRLQKLSILALLLAGGLWTWTSLVAPVVGGGVEGYGFTNVGRLRPGRVATTAFVYATGYSIGPGPAEWHLMGLRDLDPVEGLMLLLGASAFFGLALAGVSVLRRHGGASLAGGLLVPAIVGPVLVVAGCFWTGHTYSPRYAGIGYPYALCLVAAGLGHPRLKRTVLTLGVLLVALQLLSVHNLLTDARYEREDIRDAAAYVARRATESDLIVLFGGIDLPWEHYYRGAAPWRIADPADRSQWSETRLDEQVAAARVVWTVRARLWDIAGAGELATLLDERHPPDERVEPGPGVVVTRHGLADSVVPPPE